MRKKLIRTNQIEFRDLWQQLRAIALWDRIYENIESHDLIETSAWEARRKRFREIVEQIISLDR